MTTENKSRSNATTKPEGGEKAEKAVLTIRLTKQEKDDIDALAIRLKMPMTSILKLCLPFLETQKTIIDLTTDVLRPAEELMPRLDAVAVFSTRLEDVLKDFKAIKLDTAQIVAEAAQQRASLMELVRNQMSAMEAMVARIEGLEMAIQQNTTAIGRAIEAGGSTTEIEQELKELMSRQGKVINKMEERR